MDPLIRCQNEECKQLFRASLKGTTWGGARLCPLCVSMAHAELLANLALKEKPKRPQGWI